MAAAAGNPIQILLFSRESQQAFPACLLSASVLGVMISYDCDNPFRVSPNFKPYPYPNQECLLRKFNRAQSSTMMKFNNIVYNYFTHNI